MVPYQPRRIGGRDVGPSVRDCDGRYQPIRARLDAPRRILDFGAHHGYFALRLAEDYPAAEIVAVDDTPGLRSVLPADVTVVAHRVGPAELRGLGDFDATLCLSVLHHIDDWETTLEALCQMSAVLFVETPHREEILPSAVAHTGVLADTVEHLGGTVVCHTPGWDRRFLRETRMVNIR